MTRSPVNPIRTIVFVAVAAATLVLSGCTGAGSASDGPTADNTATPSTPATTSNAASPDVYSEAATMSLAPTAVDFLAADGSSLGPIDYFSPSDTAVGALSDAFSSDPVESESQDVGATDYTWGDLQGEYVVLSSSSSPASSPSTPAFRITAAATTMGDVAITTVGGLTVGSTADQVLAAGGTRFGSEPLPGDSLNGFSFQIGATDVGAGADAVTYAALLFQTDAGDVGALDAPVPVNNN